MHRSSWKIEKVDINRLNNTVKLDVKLTDTRFSVNLAQVDELSDRTSDEIETTFWASPGDVVVLAGLTRNEEATATSGAREPPVTLRRCRRCSAVLMASRPTSRRR